jgi:toxin ParE1/3/4
MGYYSFSDLAIEEIEEICEFLAQTHPRLASQWFDEVREKCKLVSSFPSMSKSYAWLDPDLRGFVIDDYIIFYYPAENGIKIIRVIHGSRDLKVLFQDILDNSIDKR